MSVCDGAVAMVAIRLMVDLVVFGLISRKREHNQKTCAAVVRKWNPVRQSAELC